MVLSTESAAAPKTTSKKTPAKKKAAPEGTLLLAQRASQLLLEKGAENVTILDVAELTSFADYFVLGSALSDRQVNALSRHVSETLKHEGHPSLSTEGQEQSHWVLMDFGGVVAHVFYGPARDYYDLDGLWSDAPRVEAVTTDAKEKAAARKKAASSATPKKAAAKKAPAKPKATKAPRKKAAPN